MQSFLFFEAVKLICVSTQISIRPAAELAGLSLVISCKGTAPSLGVSPTVAFPQSLSHRR